MLQFGHAILVFIAFLLGQSPPGHDPSKIQIINTGEYVPYMMTVFDAGPVVGNMLNAHYFPGINLYNGGRYLEAEEQFTYVLDRPHYLDANPRQAHFLSTAYYLRGTIYMHHARGVGRQTLAKSDFEAALKWNPRNYAVYLELSRLYSSLGFKEQAATILRHVLDLMPDEDIVRQANEELARLQQPN